MNRYMCDLFNVVNIGENIAPDGMSIGERWVEKMWNVVKLIYRYLCAGTSKMKVKLFMAAGIAAETYIMNFFQWVYSRYASLYKRY